MERKMWCNYARWELESVEFEKHSLGYLRSDGLKG